MPASAKVNGTWRDLALVSAKVNGSWKDVVEGYSKVNGTWQQWFVSANPAMEQIATVEVTSAVNEISISNIPSGYRNLRLIARLSPTTSTSANLRLRMNNTTGNYWVWQRYEWPSGYNRSFSSSGSFTEYFDGDDGGIETQGFFDMNINQVEGQTTGNRPGLGFRGYSGKTSNKALGHFTYFEGTNFKPITSIQVASSGNNILTGATFVLYGYKDVV